MPLIKCNNLSSAYEGVNALIGISFEVNKNDYICIVGENGAGKSTLMKCLLRLKKPSSGTIEYGDGLNANEIGYLPQQTNIQKDFPASVYEVVISGCLNKLGLFPFYTKKHNKIAMENIERLGIGDLVKKSYQELSGGQQQRVLLARALCASSKLLLLDEPVAGLDPLMTQDFYKLMEDINKNMGIAILMVSHDIHSAVKQASKILHINNTQAFFGTTDDYINSKVGKRFMGDDND